MVTRAEGSETGPALGPGDPKEVQRRGLWHDVRSLLAAATTNVEYLSTLAGVPAEGIEVAREIENEIRLATGIIEMVSSERDPQTIVELDLRVVLWLTRTSGVRIVVDATLPPSIIRGPFGAVMKLSDGIVAAIAPG